jgi:hypothetical protein
MLLTMPWRCHAVAPLATELRIDVDREEDRIDSELQAVQERMRTPGDALYGMPGAALGDPRFGVRWREADGEYYVYVEDLQARRLAGTTVFNRLVELDRRADRYLRAPHSRYAAPYRRLGLASSVYRWALDAGLCLITGARQSPAAHGLWRRLAQSYPLRYVDLRDRRLTDLGTRIDEQRLGELHTRMLLVGRGWTFEALARATGMHPAVPAHRQRFSARRSVVRPGR